jgi:hypothetical protein
VLPGAVSTDLLGAGTSRTPQQGWQLLQTDERTRIWTTRRGGRVKGKRLKGILVDTRRTLAPYVRIFPIEQRVAGREVVSYTLRAKVSGSGPLPPVLFALGMPTQTTERYGGSHHRTYNEADFAYVELKPGARTYHITHRGAGHLFSDFQLRIPPGWVVELSDLAEAEPAPPAADEAARLARDMRAWKAWNERAVGDLPRASLTWGLQDGIRR